MPGKLYCPDRRNRRTSSIAGQAESRKRQEPLHPELSLPFFSELFSALQSESVRRRSPVLSGLVERDPPDLAQCL